MLTLVNIIMIFLISLICFLIICGRVHCACWWSSQGNCLALLCHVGRQCHLSYLSKVTQLVSEQKGQCWNGRASLTISALPTVSTLSPWARPPVPFHSADIRASFVPWAVQEKERDRAGQSIHTRSLFLHKSPGIASVNNSYLLTHTLK